MAAVETTALLAAARQGRRERVRSSPDSRAATPSYKYSHTLNNEISCCASIGFVM